MIFIKAYFFLVENSEFLLIECKGKRILAFFSLFTLFVALIVWILIHSNKVCIRNVLPFGLLTQQNNLISQTYSILEEKITALFKDKA